MTASKLPKYRRIKPKAGAPPNAVERRHFDRIGAMPCLVCDRRPVTIHHVTATVHGGRISRSHQRVVPLCRAHHQHDYGNLSVERLGHAGFWRVHGIDLADEADRLWKYSEDAESAARTQKAAPRVTPSPR